MSIYKLTIDTAHRSPFPKPPEKVLYFSVKDGEIEGMCEGNFERSKIERIVDEKQNASWTTGEGIKITLTSVTGEEAQRILDYIKSV